MSTEDSGVGSVGSSTRPSKVWGLRWSNKPPSKRERLSAAEAVPVDPIVIREFVGTKKARGTAVFTCTSGELLWGQLNTVLEGWKSKEVDTKAGPYQIPFGGGTIIQQEFHYRAKAKKGTWKVEPAFIGDWHFGYVCYHEDMDGMDLLGQAAGVTFSNRKEHKSKGVVYVNRYDWGNHHDPGLAIVLETLDAGLTEEEAIDNCGKDAEVEEYLYNLVASRFMMLDPKGLPTLLQALKDGERLERKNYMLQYPEAATNRNAKGKTLNPRAADSVDSGASFGVNLVVKNPSYELGWMLFEEGELVGFVYDGEYSDLETDSAELKLGGPVSTESGRKKHKPR